MLTFQINLIRHRPVPLPQRQPIAQALLVYLLAFGVLLSWGFFHATRDVMAARQRVQLGNEQRAAFLALHKECASIDTFAANLRRQMQQVDATLVATGSLLKKRLAVANVLQELAAPLPAGARLLNLDFDVAGRALRFNLAVPINLTEGTGGTNSTPSAIMAAWRNAPVLKQTFSELREQSSQQVELDGAPFFLLHFEATLLGES